MLSVNDQLFPKLIAREYYGFSFCVARTVEDLITKARTPLFGRIDVAGSSSVGESVGVEVSK